MAKSVRTIALAATALAMWVLQAQPLQAIGPTVMMFYGGALKQPVFVTGADTAPFSDLLRPTSVTVKETAGRAYVSVALFWGSPADPAVNGVRVLTDLKPDMAWQHGRFYAAAAGQPALLLVTEFTKGAQSVPAPTNAAAFKWGGPLAPAAVAVLQRLGISAEPAR
jgi:hypothetical protein